MNKSMSKIVRSAAGQLLCMLVSIATATRVSLLAVRTSSEPGSVFGAEPVTVVVRP
jgi:hypothetical protein